MKAQARTLAAAALVIVASLLPAQTYAQYSQKCQREAMELADAQMKAGVAHQKIQQAAQEFLTKCDYAEGQHQVQETKKREAEVRARCAKPQQTLRDYESKMRQLGQQHANWRDAAELARTPYNNYHNGEYKKAFDPVDAAFSAGRQPTPEQQKALDAAELKLKSLQHEIDASQQRFAQEGPKLKAQYEQAHRAWAEYFDKMPQECQPQGGP